MMLWIMLTFLIDTNLYKPNKVSENKFVKQLIETDTNNVSETHQYEKLDFTRGEGISLWASHFQLCESSIQPWKEKNTTNWWSIQTTYPFRNPNSFGHVCHTLERWEAQTKVSATNLANPPTIFTPLHHPHKQLHRPSLVRALSKTFWRNFLKGGCFRLLNDVSLFMGPVFVQRLVQFIDQGNQEMWVGLLLVLGLFCTSFIQNVANQNYFQTSYTAGLPGSFS